MYIQTVLFNLWGLYVYSTVQFLNGIYRHIHTQYCSLFGIYSTIHSLTGMYIYSTVQSLIGLYIYSRLLCNLWFIGIYIYPWCTDFTTKLWRISLDHFRRGGTSYPYTLTRDRTSRSRLQHLRLRESPWDKLIAAYFDPERRNVFQPSAVWYRQEDVSGWDIRSHEAVPSHHDSVATLRLPPAQERRGGFAGQDTVDPWSRTPPAPIPLQCEAAYLMRL